MYISAFTSLPLFPAKKGNYFQSIIENPSKYIKPCPQKVINWIKSLSDEKRKVFLLTNSYIDYASFLLEFAVGLVKAEEEVLW